MAFALETSMFTQRLITRALTGVLCAACLGGAAFAQDAYPSRTVKFVNNFPPGGPSDIIARSLAHELQQRPASGGGDAEAFALIDQANARLDGLLAG